MSNKFNQSFMPTIRYRMRRFLLPAPPSTLLTRPPLSCQPIIWMSLGVSLGVLLMMFVATSFMVGFFYRSDIIVPRVQSYGIDLGGQSMNAAASQLEQQWRQQTIELVADETTITVDPSLLGISLDVQATAAAAHRQGRSVVMLQQWLAADGPIEILPVWRFDSAVAEANLQSMAPRLTSPPIDATIVRRGHQLEAVPATPGHTLNLATTLADLRQNLAQVLAEKQLRLVTQPMQPVVTDVSGAVAEANRRLHSDYRTPIELYDPLRDEYLTWEVTSREWAEWVSFDIPSQVNDPRLSWQIDPNKVAAFIEAQNKSLAPERYIKPDIALEKLMPALQKQDGTIRLRVYYHEQPYTVRVGESLSSIANRAGMPYPWVQAANPDIDDTLSVGQVITIPSPDLLLPLPIIEHKRIVVSISQQRMWAYEDGQEKWNWLASTGINSSPTSPGVFQIRTHKENAYADNWDIWMPHFMGIYQPAPNIDFMNGFHGFPTRDGHQLLWTNNLGSPTTFGCILIGSTEAEQLYEWAEPGVVVEIRR